MRELGCRWSMTPSENVLWENLGISVRSCPGPEDRQLRFLPSQARYYATSRQFAGSVWRTLVLYKVLDWA